VSAGAGITIVRVFAAPREEVWREWTEPARFADWFGGPDIEIPLASVEMDVRAGGQWRATMLVAPGREIHWVGEFREVVEPERLVLTFCDRPGSGEYELVIVELIDLGDGRTEMRFEQRGRMSPAQYERTKKGWTGFFDRIEERLSGRGSRAARD
jgi:uncharacterized protein YndB with AHSA1/START domain